MGLSLVRLASIATILTLLVPTAAWADRIAAGAAHALLALPDGTVWTWGDNGTGQTGEPYVWHGTPMPVPGLSNIVAVAAGSSHSLALAGDGSVWAWGNNTTGQIGNGTTTVAWTPVRLGLSSIVAVAAG